MTNFDMDELELQEFFLNCISEQCNASAVQKQRLGEFLQCAWFENMTPFEYINYLVGYNRLKLKLLEIGIFKPERLSKIFESVACIDLHTIELPRLENMPGIGPITARKFIKHTRQNQNMVLLDQPELTWLNANIIGITVPRSTPQSPTRYRVLEALYLQHSPQSISGDALVS